MTKFVGHSSKHYQEIACASFPFTLTAATTLQHQKAPCGKPDAIDNIKVLKSGAIANDHESYKQQH
jgi:hypothetical protein